jgi:hypothetical protein
MSVSRWDSHEPGRPARSWRLDISIDSRACHATVVVAQRYPRPLDRDGHRVDGLAPGRGEKIEQRVTVRRQ